MKKRIFAEGLCFEKIFLIFIFGCIFGCVFEMLVYYVKFGDLVSRKGLIYGPFNPVYGFGAVIFTLLCKQKNIWVIFLSGALLGGFAEYVCSFVQEYVFGTVSWNYKDKFLNIGGRTSLFYMVCWGILAVIFVKFVYPFLSKGIEKIPYVLGKILVIVLLIFMIFDCFISVIACQRQDERRNNIKPTTVLDVYLDNRYPDERLDLIYENAKKV